MRTQPWLFLVFSCLLSCALVAQVASTYGIPPPATTVPAVPIDPELNGVLRQIEQLASGINLELGKLRVDRWKADSGTKRQAEGNIDSVQKNLTAALPEFITAVRNSPRNIAPQFRLYRDLNALSDVLNSLAESAGAFGQKDQFERLSADINGLDAARNALGTRVESLAEAQARELAQLRQQLQAKAPPPTKTVVDDNAAQTKPKSTTRKRTKPVKPPPPQTQPQQ